MDDLNLYIVGSMFVIVVICLCFLADRIERLERAVGKLARRSIPGVLDSTIEDDDDDALPWEPGDYVENLRVNEADYGD